MISEKELFQRLADLESQKLVLSEDIRQLKADSKYNEDKTKNTQNWEACCFRTRVAHYRIYSSNTSLATFCL